MLTVKYLSLLGIMLTFLGGCCSLDLASDDEIRGQDIRPYVGLIRNFSALDISIPSADSSATLILPARSQIEYTVWQPSVDIFGYVKGKQVYYDKFRIGRQKYTFMGKSYDFLAEVCPQLPDPVSFPRQCPSPVRLPAPNFKKGMSGLRS